MSDSNHADAVQLETEQALEPVPRRRRPRAEHCRFCARENVGDVVDAGGDVGLIHRACFIEWDRKQEAIEMSMTVALSLPDSREKWTEHDLDALAAPRAA